MLDMIQYHVFRCNEYWWKLAVFGGSAFAGVVVLWVLMYQSAFAADMAHAFGVWVSTPGGIKKMTRYGLKALGHYMARAE